MFSLIKSKQRQDEGDPGAWTVQDRIEEIKGKLVLKRRDLDAYYAFSQQKIKDNDAFIRGLRTEIKEKRILQKQSFNADEYVIRNAFYKDRECQLSMQRYPIAKAISDKSEHVFGKCGQLDIVRYQRKLRLQKLRELKRLLRDLKSVPVVMSDEHKNSQRVRVLTAALDKMLMKLGSAQFIHKTYKQIFYHLERDGLTLPGRLKKLELSLQSIKTEVKNELVQIQNDAKRAYDLTKVEKEQMEVVILKAKRTRDSKLNKTRKNLKKLNQDGQEKESRTRKRATVKPSHVEEEKGMADSSKEKRKKRVKEIWQKKSNFWEFKHAMDKLLVQMSVRAPTDIAPCFKKQIGRHNELFGKVDELVKTKKTLTKTLDQLQTQLAETKQNFQDLLEDTSIRMHALQLSLDETEKFKAKTANNVTKSEDLMFSIAISVGHIRDKVSSCDWIAHKVRIKHGSQYKFDNIKHEELFESLDPLHESDKLLAYCGDRLVQLQAKFRHISNESNDDRKVHIDNICSDVTQDVLISIRNCTPHNNRIVIADDEDVLLAEDFICDDDDDNDQYLSRDAIKSAMQKMSDNVTARRKRRKQKTKV
ncbi:unnamed protein product [Clavelina lepadiformis]|uniref:Uncharacterized protein n=1 Tax=Clavelina lepadiformis TaxID=159417 RepID=A0ABP0F2R6_CLALP